MPLTGTGTLPGGYARVLRSLYRQDAEYQGFSAPVLSQLKRPQKSLSPCHHPAVGMKVAGGSVSGWPCDSGDRKGCQSGFPLLHRSATTHATSIAQSRGTAGALMLKWLLTIAIVVFIFDC